MKLNELFVDDRAVSPVVGVALLIAITVILAAVIGGVVLGVGTGGADVPQAQLSADSDAGSGTLEISHNGGEPLSGDEVVVTVDGTQYYFNSTLTAGGSIDQTDLTDDPEDGSGATLDDGDFDAGDDIAIIWQDSNSDSENILAEFSA